MAITIKENVLLAPFTVYKIGGPARFFIEVSAKEEIIEAAAFARAQGIPFFILGAGSNVLVSDAGYNGVVLHIIEGKVQIENDGRLSADAGVMMASATAEAARAGLAGFEWGIGVPGTMGGSVRGNAGCFGGEMKEALESVDIYDVSKSASRKLQTAGCEFSYRDSIFKKHPEWVILSAILKLRKENPEKIREKMLVYAKERAQKQDIGTKSCGCIFKNFAWKKIAGGKERLLKRFPEFEPFRESETLPASFVIDSAGWKGKAIGRVRVSKKHANFFVNDGGASAEEAVMLISAVKNDILRRFGIALEEEIQFVGY